MIANIITYSISEDLINHLIDTYNPGKIVIFSTAEQEDEFRNIYEKIYYKFKGKITLYSGDVLSLVQSYTKENPNYMIYGPIF